MSRYPPYIREKILARTFGLRDGATCPKVAKTENFGQERFEFWVRGSSTFSGKKVTFGRSFCVGLTSRAFSPVARASHCTRTLSPRSWWPLFPFSPFAQSERVKAWPTSGPQSAARNTQLAAVVPSALHIGHCGHHFYFRS